jgi:hypothetical protein
MTCISLRRLERLINGNKDDSKQDHALSHSCLLLSAINVEPAQTPLASVGTQVPFSEYLPDPQMMQSFEVPPEQV